MPKRTVSATKILDKALEMAEAHSWEALRLHALADELEISLDAIRNQYRQKDDLVEAWFDRADSAMLKDAASAEFKQLSSRERIARCIVTWLESLAPHRRLTREMLLYKLEFPHIHLQALGIMRISRTVQWIREASLQEATSLARIVEEAVLSSIYLATFAYWLRDNSPEFESTRKFLNRLLHQADRCSGAMQWIQPVPEIRHPSPAPGKPGVQRSEKPAP